MPQSSGVERTGESDDRRCAGDNSLRQQIGADGYSPDASRAVNLAKSLVK
jgi:hypothetical protein